METRRVADSYGGYRSRLVEKLRASGIENLAVLRAFGETPRHLFVPDAMRNRAYEDVSLPIGHGQTISQPTTQARYLEALDLKGSESVLEIGTGSGYQTALLSMLAPQIVSVERIPALAATARTALSSAGIKGASVYDGDGSLGWKPLAPYDAILVSAAGPTVPEPLMRQLSDGGRLVIPIVDGQNQELRMYQTTGKKVSEFKLGAVRFVPLVGKHGFPDSGHTVGTS